MWKIIKRLATITEPSSTRGINTDMNHMIFKITTDVMCRVRAASKPITTSLMA